MLSGSTRSKSRCQRAEIKRQKIFASIRGCRAEASAKVGDSWAYFSIPSQEKACFVKAKPVREGRALPSVICNGFGHIECGCVAAHVVRAHFAFGDYACNGGLKTVAHFVFFKPVEHEFHR
jgi:hypothetical protein